MADLFSPLQPSRASDCCTHMTRVVLVTDKRVWIRSLVEVSERVIYTAMGRLICLCEFSHQNRETNTVYCVGHLLEYIEANPS